MLQRSKIKAMIPIVLGGTMYKISEEERIDMARSEEHSAIEEFFSGSRMGTMEDYNNNGTQIQLIMEV